MKKNYYILKKKKLFLGYPNWWGEGGTVKQFRGSGGHNFLEEKYIDFRGNMSISSQTCVGTYSPGIKHCNGVWNTHRVTFIITLGPWGIALYTGPR